MDQTVRFYADKDGRYLGAYVGFSMRPPEIPGDAIEVPEAPADGRDTWDTDLHAWVPYSPPSPEDQVQTRIEAADPLIRAIAELVPGGIEAVEAKAKEILELRQGKVPGAQVIPG